MPLGTLATCLLPLLASVPSETTDPFEHAPFTLPVFRANMLLPPLSTDEPLQSFEDEYPNVDKAAKSKPHVEAANGFQFTQSVLSNFPSGQASAFSADSLAQANHFYGTWFWAEIKRQRVLGYSAHDAVKRIDLVHAKTILKGERTDEGWQAYRRLVLALLGRTGGVMSLAAEAMVRHRATPAECWRDARDENRRKVDGSPLSEYEVPIPSAGPFTGSLTLLDEVAELVFGPEVVNDRGSVDSIYRECCKILVNRVWEQMARKLKTCIKKSKTMCADMTMLIDYAKETGEAGNLVAALRHFKKWRTIAEKTLESKDLPFISQEKALEELFQQLGHDEQLGDAGKKKGQGSTGRKSKSGSLLPSEAEITAAREYWNNYCQSVQDDQDCPVPVGPVGPRFNLFDGDQDVGMDELKGMSTEHLWASLGLLGVTSFPFAEPGGPYKAGAHPKWHQIAGSLAILRGAFTTKLGEPARPTMLCDDVGLGKTLQIIGVISIIAHMHEHQEQRSDKKFVPPLFAAKHNTLYFAGHERIPTRPSLIVVPRTLSSQWMEQLKAFTKLGSFHILRFSSDQGSLARYFTDPKGEYRRAVGPDNKNACKVIILAEMSAISNEAGRYFKMPSLLGGRAAQRRMARGEPDSLQLRNGARLQGTIFDLDVKFNMVAYDESHELRNVSLMSLAAIRLSDKALVHIGATATPIFTGPKVSLEFLHVPVLGAHLGMSGHCLPGSSIAA
ncbi:hypothetical protein CTheo_8873 [Ceratobasidium theobromae]|uniref:Helicase ATP-binding domain-containing protein n=1 Tax=Ceratobasidium theobromae TaxID=1582974 RepID=A0A5N5Q8E8_9AGAM|nr:hypothetical protein CTheo_8873 [Ceratobasidium theobromae]